MDSSIETFFTVANLNIALDWCRQQRKNWPVSDAISGISLNWPTERKKIISDTLQGCYVFEPVKVIKNENAKISWLWHARDAIVIKALALQLQIKAKKYISASCTHVKGNGGVRRAVQSAEDSAKHHEFVFKSDIYSFYESIEHQIMMEQLKNVSHCPRFLKLMGDFLKHNEEFGGLYETMTKGLSKSCPLSPVLGAIYLHPLDAAMLKLKIKYIRYMDDWIFFSKKRWNLRRAIKICNQILTALKLKKHPDKTFIGRVNKTFEFLGFKFSEKGVINLAKKTILKFSSKLLKLYERPKQHREKEVTAYVRRFINYYNIFIMTTYSSKLIKTSALLN